MGVQEEVIVWRVRVVWSAPLGGPWVSTHFFSNVDGTAQQAVNAVAAFWGAVDAHIANTVSWETEAEVADVDAATGDPTSITVTTTSTGTGALTGDMLPPVVQAPIRWRTGLYIGGRERRGITYVPGIGESSATAGELASAAVTAFNTAAAALIADATSALVVYSRQYNTSTGVTSGSVNPSFAILRSRRD
jgi:hypothetical protein